MKKIGLALLLPFVCITVLAVSFSPDSYVIYDGDINQDGVDDLYLSPREKISVLGLDILTPIVFRDGPAYLIPGNRDGSFGQPQIWTSSVDVSLLRLSEYRIYVADMDGDGRDDLLLQSARVSTDSLVVYSGNGTDLVSSYSFNQIKSEYVSQDYAGLWTLRDVNGDGKTDLLINEGTANQEVGISNGASGLYNEAYGVSAFTNASANIVVGATAGALDVGGRNGDVSYSIPLQFPTGTAGITPNFSVDYSSMNGDGVLGRGFTLSGLSVISGCTSNLEDDGYLAPHWSNKVFCMDGERLIPVNSERTEFRLKRDSITRVKIVSGSPNSPARFEVRYKSGEVEIYGDSTHGGRGMLSWYVTRRQDFSGNGYDLYYQTDGSQTPVLSYVLYSNKQPANEQQVKISFNYSPMAERSKVTRYNNGIPNRYEQLLSNITATVDNNVYRTYSFQYGIAPATGVMRLQTVQECGADATCLEPTSFSWNSFDGSLNFSQKVSVDIGICPNGEKSSVYGNCDKARYYQSFQYPDINGDGYQDVCYRSTYGLVCHVNNNGVIPRSPTIITRICQYSSDQYGCNSDDNWSSVRFLDVSGDGKDDLIFRSDSGLVVYASNGNGFSLYKSFADVCPNSDCFHDGDSVFVYTPDINGDGIIDPCWIDKKQDLMCRYSSNRGNLFEFSTPEKAVTIGSRFDRRVIQFPDVDGDGDQDLLLRCVDYKTCYPDRGLWTYYRDHGTGKYERLYYSDKCAAAAHVSNCDPDLGYDVIVGNINGDAYDDVCYQTRLGISCLISTGAGYKYIKGLVKTTDTHGDFGYCGDMKSDPRHGYECYMNRNDSLMLIDYNGDGKDDLFYRSVLGPRVLISNGENFLPFSEIGGGDIGATVCMDTLTDTDCKSDADNFSTVSLADLNGDGYMDLVYRNNSGLKVHYTEAKKPSYLTDKLLSVINGHGLKQIIEYSSMLDKSVYPTPHGFTNYSAKTQRLANIASPVVKAIKTIGSNGNQSRVEYFYNNYIQMLDGSNAAGFTEFYTKKTTDFGSFVTSVRYHESGPLAGRIWSTGELYKTASGKSFSPSVVFDGLWRKSNDNSTDWRAKVWDTGRGKIYSVVNRKSTDREYSGDVLYRMTSVETFFDGETSDTPEHSASKFMDVTKQVSTVYATAAAWSGIYSSDSALAIQSPEAAKKYVTITESSYYTPNIAKWILGRLKDTRVTKIDIDGQSSSLRSEWRYYTSGSSEGLLAYEIFAPNDHVYQKKTEYTYNANGQPLTVRVTPATGEPSKTTYGYSRGVLRSTTNALGMTSIVENHSVLGLPEYSIDVNGFITTYEYDGFGRQTRVFAPGGVISETQLTGPSSVFSGTRYVETQKDNTGRLARTYFDRTGYRLGSAARGADSVMRYQYHQHNSMGTITTTYMPSTDPAARDYPAGIRTLDEQLRVTATYDSRQGLSTTEYKALSAQVTNPNGQIKTVYKRPDGKNARIVQGGSGNNVYEMTYAYDVQGNLTAVTSEGVTIRAGYDAYGHKTNVYDPDKGNWSYIYNALDQMVLQTNGKGIKTCFVYDVLGRLIKRYDGFTGTDADARNRCAGTNQQLTSWIYDTATLGDTGSLFLGSLSSVSAADGYKETYYYDHMGRSVRTDREINGQTYTELNDYDQFSRLSSHTYPSGLRIYNVYNSAGSLVEVKNYKTGYSYWKLAGYDKRGRADHVRLGNGLHEYTVFAENHSGIDHQITSRSGSLPGSYSSEDALRWLDYSYDAIDNQTSKTDRVLGLTEDFGFDALNRLEVMGLRRGGELISSEVMSYARNGNITGKPDVNNYQYGKSCTLSGVQGARQAGPHAVSTVTIKGLQRHYCYDANGNMIADNQRRLSYSPFFDKPLTIRNEAGSQIEFLYDHNRQHYYRKDVERGDVTETVNAASGYERVTKHQGTLQAVVLEKHYIAGTVVEIHTNGRSSTPERRFLHKDNLGSVVMVTSANGTVLERHSYDPWGSKRDLSGLRLPAFMAESKALERQAQANYSAYQADINGDGYQDLYVRSAPDWVLIATRPSFLVPTYGAQLYLGTSDGHYTEPVNWFGSVDVSGMTLTDTLPVRNETTRTGFTGHELMESVGLIHMGGRIYDPAIGRMLNADPFVQAPDNSQSFNRYSYVMNNPVSLIDPSGYLWNPIKKVSGAISRLGTYIGSRGAQLDDWQRHYTDNFGQWVRKEAANNPRTAALLQVAACAATSGVGCVLITGVSTAVLTQDIKAGVRAAAIAATYQGIAGAIGDYGGASTGARAARVGMHGLLGGAYSRYNHGSFWRGAISTMAAEGYAEFVPSKWSAAKALGNGRVAHAMEAALIGGTSQVIMGGGTQGFVNGAISAAMSRLYNWCGKQGSTDNSCGSRMPETADGTAMDYDIAADLASGLVPNNISHSCGSFEVSVCTGVRTLFGGREVEAFTTGTSMASVYADTRSAVGHVETYADSIGYKIKGFTRDVFKIIGFGGLAVDRIINAGANYNGARAWCTASCGMDRWNRELLLENQLKAKGD